MRQLLFIAAIISVIACNQNKTENKETKTEVTNPALDSARNGIEKALAAHIDADLKGDALAATQVFEDSATYLEYGSPTLIGRAALDNYEIELFKQVQALDVKHEIEGLTLHGNVAYQLGKLYLKIKTRSDGQESEINGRYMATWRKQSDGSWRILYFVYYP